MGGAGGKPLAAAASDVGPVSKEVGEGPGGGGGSSGSRRPSLGDMLGEAIDVALAGMMDALMLHRCVGFLARSEVIRFRTLQCFVLNGVIFLGSILLFNFAVAPLLGLLRHLVQDEDVWAADFVGSSFAVLYKLLWIYPIYCISFVLNTVMYQEVADSAMALPRHCSASLRHQPKAGGSPLGRVINEAFRVLLNLVYIIEMYLLYYVPVIGPILYFILSCWLASIYCFEYRWVHLRWTSNARLEYFERHWLYFLGFGFPVAFASFLCPRFVDAGVYALLFPLNILTAAAAEPRALKLAPKPLQRWPVFMAVQGFSCLMLRLFEGRLTGPPPSLEADAPKRKLSERNAGGDPRPPRAAAADVGEVPAAAAQKIGTR